MQGYFGLWVGFDSFSLAQSMECVGRNLLATDIDFGLKGVELCSGELFRGRKCLRIESGLILIG